VGWPRAGRPRAGRSARWKSRRRCRGSTEGTLARGLRCRRLPDLCRGCRGSLSLRHPPLNPFRRLGPCPGRRSRWPGRRQRDHRRPARRRLRGRTWAGRRRAPGPRRLRRHRGRPGRHCPRRSRRDGTAHRRSRHRRSRHRRSHARSRRRRLGRRTGRHLRVSQSGGPRWVGDGSPHRDSSGHSLHSPGQRDPHRARRHAEGLLPARSRAASRLNASRRLAGRRSGRRSGASRSRREPFPGPASGTSAATGATGWCCRMARARRPPAAAPVPFPAMTSC
jgi:hypothetical protein